MKYNLLKEMNLSRLVLGTGKYASLIPEDEAFELIDKYIECGGNVIDTAEVYGDWVKGAGKSASEKCIGKWIKNNPDAAGKIYITTKGAHYRIADPERKSRVRPECIFEDMSKSLDNLHVDKIDLYWLHRDDPTYPVEPVMDALFEAVNKKIVSHIGASNWTRERIDEANSYASKCGYEGFVSSQICLSYVRTLCQAGVGPEPDKTMLFFDEDKDPRYFEQKNMPVFAYSSQAHGYITKILEGKELVKAVSTSYDSEENRLRAHRAGKIAEKTKCSAEAVGLGYLFSYPFNVFAIVGPRTIDQMENTMDAADIMLTDEQIEYLKEDVR